MYGTHLIAMVAETYVEANFYLYPHLYEDKTSLNDNIISLYVNLAHYIPLK